MPIDIFVPRHNFDGWSARVSDGTDFNEYNAKDDFGAWHRLAAYCRKNRVHITRLSLSLNGVTVACEGYAKGFWHANKMAFDWNDPGHDITRHWRGIGYVTRDDMVHITWLAYPHADILSDMPTPSYIIRDLRPVAMTCEERRPTDGQVAIIWNDHARL